MEGLSSFNPIVGVEITLFFELKTKLDVFSGSNFVCVRDFSGLHVLEHSLSLVRVDGVEIISNIAIIEVLNNGFSSWMDLGELGHVIESVLDDDVDFLGLGGQDRKSVV